MLDNETPIKEVSQLLICFVLEEHATLYLVCCVKIIYKNSIKCSFSVITGGHSAKSQLFLKVLLHRQFFVQLILQFCRQASLKLLDKLMDVHFLAT